MQKLSLTNKYTQYPKYKDSGVEWVGDVPETWDVATSRRLFHTKKKLASETESQKVLSLTLNGVLPRVMDGSGKNPANYDTYQEFLKGDLVFCLFDYDVTPRTIGYVEENGMMTSAYTRLIPKSETDSKFFYYYFLYLDYTKELLHLCTGLRNSISKPLFWSLKNPLPAKEEQEKIARFLDERTARIDETIAKKERLIELLKEKRTAIINYAVTKGLEHDAELVESGIGWIGKIPKSWRVSPLKHVTFMQEGPGIMAEDFKENGVPLLRIRNLKNREIDLDGSNFLDQDKANTKWKHFQLTKGDLLVSGSASTGVVSEVGESAVGAIPYTGLIRITAKKVEKDFLYYVLASRYYNEQIDVQKTGTAMQHYGPTHLKKVSITLPPKQEQQEIVKELEKTAKDYLTAQDQITSSIKLLQELKSSLISNTVTGKIKI